MINFDLWEVKNFKWMLIFVAWVGVSPKHSPKLHTQIQQLVRNGSLGCRFKFMGTEINCWFFFPKLWVSPALVWFVTGSDRKKEMSEVTPDRTHIFTAGVQSFLCDLLLSFSFLLLRVRGLLRMPGLFLRQDIGFVSFEWKNPSHHLLCCSCVYSKAHGSTLFPFIQGHIGFVLCVTLGGKMDEGCERTQGTWGSGGLTVKPQTFQHGSGFPSPQ